MSHTAISKRDGRDDFSFLFGRWIVHNRQSRQYTDPHAEWFEFSTTCEARPILGGLGNIDEFHFGGEDSRAPWDASTIRIYEPTADLWRIYWASSAHPGPLGDPMEGRFRDGRGEFFGIDVTDRGRAEVRFIWTHSQDDHARWEQAFRFPGDGSWSTNWVMEFMRPG